MQPGTRGRGHTAKGRGGLAPTWRVQMGGGRACISPRGPLLVACSSCLHLKRSPPPAPPSLPLAPLFAAPPVKGKRKQSEEGDPLDPSVSPQPDGEQSRSQSPIHLEVSGATPGGLFPAPPPLCIVPGELRDSSGSQADVFPTLQSAEPGECPGPVVSGLHQVWELGARDRRTLPSPVAGVSDLDFLAEPICLEPR